MSRPHYCVGGVLSDTPSTWLKDGRGIELCRACPKCKREKLARYRPEILHRAYTEADVDEPIEAEDGGLT